MSDFSERYNTPLSASEMGLYEQWLKTLPKHQRNVVDYDMQGAFASGIASNNNGHFSDAFKKPNHPTFSTQSKYSGTDGYVGGEWRNVLGVDMFVPSKTNIEQNEPSFLREYFKRVEPNALLMYDLNDILNTFPQFKEDRRR